jgi:hypothetical protein
MNVRVVSLGLLLLLPLARTARPDFAGPTSATHALSPNGDVAVRIETLSSDPKGEQPPKHELSYYEFDPSSQSYHRRASFEFQGKLPQLLFVSDHGDVVMVSLWHDDKTAIRLYSKNGKLVKSWSVKKIMTKAEAKACALTGSTIQWFDEGSFGDRTFYFSGPSHMIRGLRPSYTVMRGADEKVFFSGSINAETGQLTKDKAETP